MMKAKPEERRAAASMLAQQLGRRIAAGLAAAPGGDDALPPLHVAPAPLPTAPERLAGSHPGGAQARREAKALYQRCLAHYRAQFQAGQAQDDVGAAAACFALANLAALQEVTANPAELARVERQMRRLIGRSTAWIEAGTAERQALFEQFAVLGVLVGESQAEARRQGPAALVPVQRAARGYVLQLLGVDADALQLTPEGLGLRRADRAVA